VVLLRTTILGMPNGSRILAIRVATRECRNLEAPFTARQAPQLTKGQDSRLEKYWQPKLSA
jgi:hypothetical protein